MSGEVKKQGFGWSQLVEIASDVVLICAAVGYWLNDPYELSQVASITLYALALGILLFQIGASLRRAVNDPELETEGRVFVGATGTVLSVLVSAPLVYWGFLYAVMGRYAGA